MTLKGNSHFLNDLLQKKELFQLVEQLKIGAYLFDTDGNSIDGNKHFLEMLEYDLDELRSKRFNEIFDGVDLNTIGEGNPCFQGKKQDGKTVILKYLLIKNIDHHRILLLVQNITEETERQTNLDETNKHLKDYQYALDQAATVSITDPDGNITYVNDRFCEVSGYSREELIGRNHRIVKSGYHPKAFFEKMWSTITKGKTFQGEVCNRAKNGTIWWGFATIVPFLDENNKPYQYLAIRQDITQQKLMEEQIRLNDRRFKSLIINAYDIIAILNKDFIVEYLTPNFEELTLLSEEDFIGKRADSFIHEEDKKEFVEMLKLSLEEKGKPFQVEVRAKDHTGKWIYYDVVLTNLLHDDAVKGIVANFRNINDKKEASNQIYKMAYYDYLTGLPNRRKFMEQIEQVIMKKQKKNGQFTLMIVDIHGLKFINDLLGTKVGDLLLIEAAKRMEKFVNGNGVLSRIDGDEFAFILPSLSDKEIERKAIDLISLFSEPFTVQQYELFLAINIGISRYPQSGKNIQLLVKNAYSAMHVSKSIGRNQFQIYSTKMNKGYYKRFFLKNDLRKALANNEFFLQYQPRVNVKSNIIIGAEALIRWKHPEWGLIPPVEFIPLAEEEGLIGELGEMVLREACRQNKEWQNMGLPPVVVSVNFSVIQFLESDMIEMVKNILEETDLEPQWLEIEITESALMKDKETVLKKIEKLKEMGITTAIDDFGTGYASLSYLKHLKANTLKIDRSFINGIPVEHDSSEIVSSIIQLAKKLDIRTVAEGVETYDQLELLQEINCDEIQGYLFSKPVSVDDFEEMLKSRVCLPAGD